MSPFHGKLDPGVLVKIMFKAVTVISENPNFSHSGIPLLLILLLLMMMNLSSSTPELTIGFYCSSEDVIHISYPEHIICCISTPHLIRCGGRDGDDGDGDNDIVYSLKTTAAMMAFQTSLHYLKRC